MWSEKLGFETWRVCMHPELSGCIIITLTVRNMEVANFCTAMDTLISQDGLYADTC